VTVSLMRSGADGEERSLSDPGFLYDAPYVEGSTRLGWLTTTQTHGRPGTLRVRDEKEPHADSPVS
jgi:hypothetical protein